MPLKKKVLMIGSLPPPYHGSNVYFAGLLDSHVKEKYDVSHVDISDHRGLENLSKLDTKNIELAIKGIYGLKKKLKEMKPDLVYIPVASNFLPFLRDGLFILTAHYYSKAKIVIHLHEGSYFRDEFHAHSNLLSRKFIEFALSKVDTAIVYTRDLESTFKGLVRRVVSFLNGKDVIIPQSNTASRGKNLNISYIGNLFESKGIINYLKSAAIIARSKTNVIFPVAGDWGADKDLLKPQIDKIISENGLEGKVKFLGSVTGNKLNEFYGSTDILIFPTKYPYEGCPLVLIDAMGFGLPIISSKGIGAIPEMITNGVDGILTDPNNPEEIAESALQLIENEEERIRLGIAARKKYEESFTKEINVNNVVRTFEETMNTL